MTQLFDEVVVFTDIHLGWKNNSKEHNEDCVQFIEWMIKEAHARGITKCIFMGDWHHSRSTINVKTLNYSTKLWRLLNASFEEIYFIVGNHDLFYKEDREISSVEFVNDYKNFIIVDEPAIYNDVGFVPWVVSDEWDNIQSMDVTYMFGHFEFPKFKVNANYEMPDHGKYAAEDLKHIRTVFSGHFHKRQNKNNVQYIGNCFPHSYSDVDEETERGIMFLKWGEEPEYQMWPGTPRFRYRTISQAVENYHEIEPKTFMKATIDVEVDFEDIAFVKETLSAFKDMKELTLVEQRRDVDFEVIIDGEEQFESVDATVISNLQQIESNIFDSNYLIQIYEDL